jgi:hypothetical protein
VTLPAGLLHAGDSEVFTPHHHSRFLGAASCASSSCHGGGDSNQNQYLIWALKDFHAQRPFATLTTARSKQIADALQIEDPAADIRCTSCHAPLRQVPADRRGESFQVSEGVSCESCHGPAEDWLLGHTRTDWTRSDRVYAGMRDLKNPYVRANTCVACHQTLESPLRKAGHPELIFELDGQGVSQPTHWRNPAHWSGAQAWLVGQAAALREMSWQLSRESAPEERLIARWSGLLWLLQKLDSAGLDLPNLGLPGDASTAPDFAAVQMTADNLARRASETRWSEAMTRSVLTTLAASGADFRQSEIPRARQARRAERLVLALDRLLAAQPHPEAEGALNDLFELVQSLPDFDAERFSMALDRCAEAIGR